jgi:hypothetical protein
MIQNAVLDFVIDEKRSTSRFSLWLAGTGVVRTAAIATVTPLFGT